MEYAGEINADYNDIVSNTNVLGVVDKVEAIVLNEDSTSGKAIVNEFLTKVGAVFNTDGKADPNGTKWENLDSRTRARVLLNNITQKNIRDILGESGKTISNLDRQIVERLVGTLKAGTTDAEILETLELTRSGIITNRNNSARRLNTNYLGMQKYGDVDLINNPDILSYIKNGVLQNTQYSGGGSSKSGQNDSGFDFLERVSITLQGT